MAEWHDGAALVLAGIAEAEKTWRRLMGKADMAKLVTALRQLDLARAAPAMSKRAA